MTGESSTRHARSRGPGRALAAAVIAVVVIAVGGIAVGISGTSVASAVSSPTITTVDPSSLPQGASHQPVTLGGTNFESGARVVSHSGIHATAKFVNATHLDLSITVAATVAPGPYNLDLTNPDGGAFVCKGCLTVNGPVADWPAYLNGPAHSSYNGGATSITPADVGSLDPVWRWLPHNGTGKNKLWASPTAVDGIVYIGSWAGWFYAVSEASQAVLWSKYLGVVKGTTCGSGRSGILSTATVTTDPGTGKLAVYVNAPDGRLYAMDAATGDVLWTGVVGIPSTTVNDFFAWGSPLVSNGSVYIGVSSECDNPLVRGGLLRFTQDSATSTNPVAATFHTLPDSVTCPPLTTPGCGGSIWSSPGLAGDGSIIVTTGNGPGAIDNPPYSASMVKLDPDTLAVLASFTVPLAEQSQDSDWGGSPTMFTAVVDGVVTPMVGGCNKNGHYYGLRQRDLKLVWDYVMGSPNMPGQAQQCDAAAIWDGTHLIEGGGSSTTIDGTTYPGSVQSLYPASGSADGTETGAPVWQTGLPGNIVGSPTEDGAGVVAAQVYFSATGNNGVYLLDAATGAVLGFLPEPTDLPTPTPNLFGQAVWVGDDLLVGAGPDLGLTDYEVTRAGPAITAITPSTLTRGTSATLTITGSGFGHDPKVVFTNTLVQVSSITVVSATELTVKVTAYSTAPAGPATVVVSQPGSPDTAGSCSSCLTVN